MACTILFKLGCYTSDAPNMCDVSMHAKHLSASKGLYPKVSLDYLGGCMKVGLGQIFALYISPVEEQASRAVEPAALLTDQTEYPQGEGSWLPGK